MRRYLHLFLISWIALALAPSGATAGDLRRFEYSGVEMAVPIRIVLYAPNKPAADRAAKAALARIHHINEVMSDYHPTSEVRRLSATSGTGQSVAVSDDLWRVLVASDRLARRSEGAFDVTVGPIVRLWRRARRRQELPKPQRIEEFLRSVGHEKMLLDPARRSVRLTQPGMWIDLGGIAKGFAIDEALAVLRKGGIERALVDAGGDIGLGAPPPEKPGWLVAVAPLESSGKPSVFLSLSRLAIATSGDMWQYVEIGGKRYSHIVDPRTGMGLTDHSSVTVIAADAITADGLASALSVLGPAKGFRLLDEYCGSSAMVIRQPGGKVETSFSARWPRDRQFVSPAAPEPPAERP